MTQKSISGFTFNVLRLSVCAVVCTLFGIAASRLIKGVAEAQQQDHQTDLQSTNNQIPEKARIALDAVVDDEPLRDDAGLDALLALINQAHPAAHTEDQTPTALNLKKARRGDIFAWQAHDLTLKQATSFGRAGLQAWVIQPEPSQSIPPILLFVKSSEENAKQDLAQSNHLASAHITAMYWKRCTMDASVSAKDSSIMHYDAMIAVNIADAVPVSLSHGMSAGEGIFVILMVITLTLSLGFVMIIKRWMPNRHSTSLYVSHDSADEQLMNADVSIRLPSDAADALSVLHLRAESHLEP